ADVDYDLWCGPAEKKDLYREKFHYDWHWDWNTGCGEMGNWGVHVFDDLKNNILRDKVLLPKRIMAGGARVLYNDAGNTPNVHFVYFDTGIVPVVLGLSNIPEAPGARSAGKHIGPGSGYVAFCEGGRLEGQRGKAKAFDQDGKVIREFKGDSGNGHVQNFLDGVKSRDRSVLNAEAAVGNASSNWCNIANIAVRCGKPYTQKDASQLDGKTEGRWEELIADTSDLLQKNGLKLEGGDFRLSPLLTLDSERCVFVGENAEIANKFVKRTYRKGFVVPEIG
ncbi:MAG: gfo/Idh/MocA family oxidoreductase, partial [Planctomycetia bacterium]|nr:gfo/Idh/MocA family oxidoreductase [Planctomycetia bacterium]